MEKIKSIVGFKILDKTQREFGDEVAYNSAKAYIHRFLGNIIDNNSQICGFTLTLCKTFHEDEDIFLHRYIHRSISNSRIWKGKKYIIFPEYTARGILHYHGIMWGEYDSEVMRCIKWWKRKYGFVKPELRINSKANWIKYITKDYGRNGLWTIYDTGGFSERVSAQFPERIPPQGELC